jgi:1,4-alpha-glucan branching enzyme
MPQRYEQLQRFALTAPAARSVLLAGDFTHWKQNPIALEKRNGGIWTTTVSLPPGTYHYRFIVDGEWHDDPDCVLHARNPYGTEDSVRKVA